MHTSAVGGAALDEAVFVEQIRLLSRRRYDLFVNLAVSAVFAIALWRIYPLWERESWLAAVWAVILAREVIRRKLRSVSGANPSKSLAQAYTALTFAAGLLWGVTGTVLLLTPDPIYAVLTTFVLAGLMAGGIVINAPYRPSLWAFLSPILLPTIAILLARSTSIEIELGLLLAVFGAVMTAAGLGVNAMVVESLRLWIEQEFLVVELRARESAVQAAQRLAHVGGIEFNLANDTIVGSDEFFRIVERNPARFEPSLDALLELVHPEDRARVAARVSAFPASGVEDKEIDYRLLMDDGSIKFVRSTGRSIDGRRGRKERYLASVQDVTELTKALNEIAYRNRLLDAVTAGAATALASDSIDSGVPKALRTLGESMRLDRIDVIQEAPDLTATVALRYEWVAKDLAMPVNQSVFVDPPACVSELTEVRARLESGQVVIGQLGAGPLQALLERMNLQSFLLVPIVVDRELWGSLGIDSSRNPRTWTAVEIDTLKTFASIVGSLVGRFEATPSSKPLSVANRHEALEA